MKQGHFILSAAIAAALAGAPVLAQPVAANNLVTAAATSEAPRITQTINNQLVSPLAKTHLKFVETTAPAKPLADTFTMNHLQLVLKPSAARQAALTSLIADQHNPKSSSFQKWLTPEQFGESYGVMDSDVAAVTSWLKSQGFTVNNVYPNKTQIDFSGTVGQVKAVFHTQENIYSLGGGIGGKTKEQHIANAGDISIPVALKDVVAGVMGLNDFHPKAMNKPIKAAKWDATKKSLVLSQPTASSKVGGKSQAISVSGNGDNPQGTIRGLVPNDLATMYGIKTIRANGVTGKGITIAVVEDQDMVPADWTNFTSIFNLAKFGGTFNQFNPAPPSGPNNCSDPSLQLLGESGETVLDAEWSTAIAPSANIWVATCSDYTADFSGYATSNAFGGVYLAADNLVNAPSGSRPDIISTSYGYGEQSVDSASKTAIDLMWAQADAEGISVFVSTGDSGSNPDFNGGVINGYQGYAGVDANAFATSPNDTGVGGTDLADVLDGTSSQYFAATPSVVGGSALSYVPEIPWNESCGNGVAATSLGYASAVGFCNAALNYALNGVNAPVSPLYYYKYTFETSEGGSGGPSSVDRKPTWQRQVYNAAPDQSRDLPDVALFAGSFGDATYVVVCGQHSVCSSNFTPGTTADPDPANVGLSGGTSLAAPMFAGIQALIDQGLAARGLPQDQGNAAPTLYALAANEYGTASQPNSAGLSTCNANNGATGTSGCVFHNVTRGSISTGCYSYTGTGAYAAYSFATPNCYYYNSALYAGTAGSADTLMINVGLTTSDANPTSYSPTNKAFSAQPGWSFASGLGSVNATNLLIAWRAFVGAPAAPPPAP